MLRPLPARVRAHPALAAPAKGHAMPVKVDALLDQAVKAGLLHDDLSVARDALPLDKRDSPEDVLTELVRRGKLTSFQAKHILKGKAKALVLGSYILQEPLGQGGMGMVFRARHSLMERTAAIKLLPPSLDKNPENVQRFLREVKAAAKLEHPNIVQAYDAGSANGRYFLAMECVEGKTLDRLVKDRGRLPVSIAVDYVVQAARGLAFAHQRNIIHRDIKPSNLILGPKNRVQILDMGLARIMDSGPAKSVHLTGVDTSMGTVDFMAPEQALELKMADARSDVYSLGCTLYFLIRGDVMFAGAPSTSRMLAHQQKDPPSLSEGRSDVPLRLDAVYQRMVAKRPEDRYATAAEALAELQKCMGSSGVAEAIVVPKPASGGAADKPTGRIQHTRRHTRPKPNRRMSPALIGAIVGIVVLVPVVIGVIIWAASGKREELPSQYNRLSGQQVQNQRTGIAPVNPPNQNKTPVAFGPSATVLSYDFRDADGGGLVNREGQYSNRGAPNHAFTLFSRNQRNTDEQFHIEAYTDKDEKGPDGQPGILRFQLNELPSDINFLGFSYLGRGPAGDFSIPYWRPGALGQADLQELTISLRYKSNRPTSWNFRMEPNDDPYNNRLEFGDLRATTQWATFTQRFSDGKNLEQFLRAVNGAGALGLKLKLTWASAGVDYRPGDMLLIDDIRIERQSAIGQNAEPPPATRSPSRGSAKNYSFADARGGGWLLEGDAFGQTGSPKYRMTMFGKPKDAGGGQVRLAAVEQGDEVGADSQQGVLCLQVLECPRPLAYAGFEFHGKFEEDGFEIPELHAGKLAAGDLSHWTVSFQHRAIRAAEGQGKPLRFGWYLQPKITEGDRFATALKFEPFEASGDWRAASIRFNSGKDAEAFLKAFNGANTNRCSLIWSLLAEENYLSGDVLLIDDVRITFDPM